MPNHRLLAISFVLVLTLGTMHFLASSFYLYWTVWWFDNVMHFFGGLAIGMSGFWLWHRFGLPGIFASVLSLVLIVGIGWEAFEYIFGISDPSFGETYFEDTFYDFVADMLGFGAAAYIYKKGFHD